RFGVLRLGPVRLGRVRLGVLGRRRDEGGPASGAGRATVRGRTLSSPALTAGLGQTVGIPRDTPLVASDFVEMYEVHYPRLVRALEIGGLDRATAEDTAQEAFARTLGHVRRVRLGSNPPGYVYRVGFRVGRRSF